ncbi:MAG: hypothetical protein ACR2OO_04730, partial [Thermomicrobiales bacterium]
MDGIGGIRRHPDLILGTLGIERFEERRPRRPDRSEEFRRRPFEDSDEGNVRQAGDVPHGHEMGPLKKRPRRGMQREQIDGEPKGIPTDGAKRGEETGPEDRR